MKLTHPWSTASLALGLFFLLNISIANAAVQVPLTPERLSVYQVDAEDSSYLGKAALRLKHHMKDGYVQIEGLEFANGEIEVELLQPSTPIMTGAVCTLPRIRSSWRTKFICTMVAAMDFTLAGETGFSVLRRCVPTVSLDTKRRTWRSRLR